MVFVFVGMFCVPAYASTNAEYNQVTTFWHWSKDVPLWGDWVAYSTDKTCAVSEDKYHHASTYQTANEDGYFTCICTYCGQMFTAYESDLKQSYDDQVAELPATGITSAGRLIWQPTFADANANISGSSDNYFRVSYYEGAYPCTVYLNAIPVPVRLLQDFERRITMAEIVAEFFGIIGVDVVPPETLAELIPYLLTVLVGVVLVSTVFRVLGRLAEAVLDIRRW